MVMRRHTLIFIAITMLGIFILPGPAKAQETAAALPGATQQLKITLDAILDILLDPKLKDEQHKAQRMDMVQALFRQRFDEKTFCVRALGKHWKERSETEQKEFIDLFSDLLVTTYLERIDGYLNSNDSFSTDDVIYLGQRETKKYTLVKTDVKLDEAQKIPVLYRIENIEDKWMVTDIAIEGISLLRNYRAQFNEIIANSGYNELLKRLKAKQV